MKHLIAAFLLVTSTTALSAHCQIPCGIYHDEMVIKGMEEDIETLTKAVKEINTNSKVTPLDNNQLIRWVINKDKHADKLANTLVEYYLQQRIKTDDPKLQEKLTSVHKMLVLSMKVKQTVDLKVVVELSNELGQFNLLMNPPHTHDDEHDEKNHK